MLPARERASTSTSSSPAAERPPLLAIARVTRAHGLRGGLLCQILTDFPERFASTREVLVGDPPVARVVEQSRLQGARVVLKLEGVGDRAAAEELAGALISVTLDQAVSLPPGQYFWHQIEGLRVETCQGRALGTIVEILPTGGNDVYVVRTERGELLLPAIKDVVREVDLDRGVMRVELLPGLES